jgi:alpha-1,2-mannosyltransferase
VRLVLLAIAAVLILSALFTYKVSSKMPDMEVYWKAAVRARAAEPLYRAEDEHFQFKYLPAFAVLAIPAGFLPLPAAKAVWFAISAALIVLVIALGIRMLPAVRQPSWVLAAAAIVAMGKFYGHEVVLGQVNLLFAAIVAAAIVLLRGGHEAAAGALIAAAVIVKPYAVIFLPWLAARRQLASLASVSAGLVIALLLPAAIYGWDGNITLLRDWWRTVSESTAPNLLNNDNVSAAAMWAKWLGPGGSATMLASVTSIVLVLAAAVVFAWRRDVRFPEGLEAAFLLTLVPLLSPQGWDYVFLLATPAVLFVANYAGEFRRPLRIVMVATLLTIGLSLYDVLGRANYARFMQLSIISVCFFVVLALVAVLRGRKVA